MDQYHFIIDTKFTAWDREHYTIEASTQEEANKMMFEYFRKNEFSEDVQIGEVETLLDTREDISPEENEGAPTRELYMGSNSREGRLLAVNSQDQTEPL